MIVGVLPKPPRFLELAEVLTLHEAGIEEFGGKPGVRDQGLLESAIAVPRQTVAEEFAHSIPFGMAAAYAFHLCKNHPFHDGNKRAALAAMVVFLRLNGWELNVPDFEAADRILAVAQGSLGKDSLAAGFRAPVVRGPPSSSATSCGNSTTRASPRPSRQSRPDPSTSASRP